jgi:hypothetical protein
MQQRVFAVVEIFLALICTNSASSRPLSDADLSYIFSESIFAENSLPTCIQLKDRAAGSDYNAIAQYIIEGCFVDYYYINNQKSLYCTHRQRQIEHADTVPRLGADAAWDRANIGHSQLAAVMRDKITRHDGREFKMDCSAP